MVGTLLICRCTGNEPSSESSHTSHYKTYFGSDGLEVDFPYSVDQIFVSKTRDFGYGGEDNDDEGQAERESQGELLP